jgi:hypothetical protein
LTVKIKLAKNKSEFCKISEPMVRILPLHTIKSGETRVQRGLPIRVARVESGYRVWVSRVTPSRFHGFTRPGPGSGFWRVRTERVSAGHGWDWDGFDGSVCRVATLQICKVYKRKKEDRNCYSASLQILIFL